MIDFLKVAPLGQSLLNIELFYKQIAPLVQGAGISRSGFH